MWREISRIKSKYLGRWNKKSNGRNISPEKKSRDSWQEPAQ